MTDSRYHNPLISIAGFTSEANTSGKMAFGGYFMYSPHNCQIIAGRIVNPLGHMTIVSGTFSSEGLKFKARFKLGQEWIESSASLVEKQGKYSGNYRDGLMREGLMECVLSMVDERAYIETVRERH